MQDTTGVNDCRWCTSVSYDCCLLFWFGLNLVETRCVDVLDFVVKNKLFVSIFSPAFGFTQHHPPLAFTTVFAFIPGCYMIMTQHIRINSQSLLLAGNDWESEMMKHEVQTIHNIFNHEYAVKMSKLTRRSSPQRIHDPENLNEHRKYHEGTLLQSLYDVTTLGYNKQHLNSVDSTIGILGSAVNMRWKQLQCTSQDHQERRLSVAILSIRVAGDITTYFSALSIPQNAKDLFQYRPQCLTTKKWRRGLRIHQEAALNNIFGGNMLQRRQLQENKSKRELLESRSNADNEIWCLQGVKRSKLEVDGSWDVVNNNSDSWAPRHVRSHPMSYCVFLLFDHYRFSNWTR